MLAGSLYILVRHREFGNSQICPHPHLLGAVPVAGGMGTRRTCNVRPGMKASSVWKTCRLHTTAAPLIRTSRPESPRMLLTSPTTLSIEALSLTSRGRTCSWPRTSFFRAWRADAFSGVRHVAITMFCGWATSCFTTSRPMPLDVLVRAGSLACFQDLATNQTEHVPCTEPRYSVRHSVSFKVQSVREGQLDESTQRVCGEVYIPVWRFRLKRSKCYRFCSFRAGSWVQRRFVGDPADESQTFATGSETIAGKGGDNLGPRGS